jgi:UPF0716 family protein affecting phage T7 exclusion
VAWPLHPVPSLPGPTPVFPLAAAWVTGLLPDNAGLLAIVPCVRPHFTGDGAGSTGARTAGTRPRRNASVLDLAAVWVTGLLPDIAGLLPDIAGLLAIVTCVRPHRSWFAVDSTGASTAGTR